jgi:hypothetical protein
MKKTVAIIVLSVLGLNALQAQSNWELGARFGNDFALDLTVPLSAARLHPAVYFDKSVAFGLYFDWLFDLEGDEPTGFRVYPGVGPEFYFYDGLDIAAAGNFGAEYSFKIPLTVGIDWRPNLMLTESMHFNGNNWGIFARFHFGKGVKLVKSK